MTSPPYVGKISLWYETYGKISFVKNGQEEQIHIHAKKITNFSSIKKEDLVGACVSFHIGPGEICYATNSNYPDQAIECVVTRTGQLNTAINITADRKTLGDKLTQIVFNEISQKQNDCRDKEIRELKYAVKQLSEKLDAMQEKYDKFRSRLIESLLTEDHKETHDADEC